MTVVLVDARSWTREALARALEKAGHGIRVIQCVDVKDLASIEPDSAAKVVLLNLPGASFTNRRISNDLAAIAASLPDTPVVAISDRHDTREILGGIECGLKGYIPMSLELRSVIEALHFMADGGTFAPADLLLSELDVGALPKDVPAGAAEPSRADAAPDLSKFTSRELAVLDLVRQAKSNKHIARELHLSEATVKVHVRHIMRKLGAMNRTQVALLAERLLG